MDDLNFSTTVTVIIMYLKCKIIYTRCFADNIIIIIIYHMPNSILFLSPEHLLIQNLINLRSSIDKN